MLLFIPALFSGKAQHMLKLLLRPVFILLIFPFASLFGQNQKRVDSLLARLNQTAVDSVKAKIYLDLGYEWSDIDQPKARQYLQTAEKLFSKNKNQFALCDVFFNMAIVYEYEHKRDSSLLFFKKAIELGTRINHSGFLGRAYVGLGWSHTNAHEYPAALDAYHQALDISEKTGNNSARGDATRKIANLYIQMGEPDNAFIWYRKALDLYRQMKDSISISQVLGGIGFAYRSVGRYDSAIIYLKEAVTAFKSLGYLTMIPVAYTEMGMAYLQDNHYPEAEAQFRQAIAYHKASNYIGHQDALYINLGLAMAHQKKYTEAKTSIEKGLAIALETEDLELQRDAYAGLATLYEMQGDYKQAYTFNTRHQAVKDSLEMLEQKEQLRELTAKYDTEKKDKQIAEQTVEINRKKYWLWSSIAFILFGALLVYNYYRRWSLKKEKQLQEEVMKQQDLATRAVLEAEEKERKRIAAELHDGVGQTMSAALMNLDAFRLGIPEINATQSRRLEKIIALVDEGCREVRTVSHNMMPNALLKSGLANAVRDFVNKIDSRVLQVDFYSEGLNEHIDTNIETVLYRVIQECVNNVIKHSGATHLDISLIHDASGISITVEDNGRGFDTSQTSKFDGIGLKNILTRINYLKGTVDFTSMEGKGTVVVIHVPLEG
jgi:two-component system NarL family sensor kinase